jgi:hypothetical protein
MRTVTFQSVLDGAASRIGLDPTQTIQASTASALTEYINTRVRFAWEAYKWPELSCVEKRAFRGPYSSVLEYPIGSEVLHENNYYRKSGAAAIGIAPDTAFAWTDHDPNTAYVINDIVKSNKIYYKCKKVVPAKANILITNSTYWDVTTLGLGADTWKIATEPNDSVFPIWTATGQYQAGSEVVYKGNFYRARVAVKQGDLPSSSNWNRIQVYSDFIRSIDFEQPFTMDSATSPATEIGEVIHVYAQDPRIARYAERVNFWVTDQGIIVGSTQFTNLTPNFVYVEFTKRPTLYNTNSADSDFPRVLSEYVKFAAAADALREDGQFDKAVYMDGLAVDALQKEIDIIELKQGQTRLQSNRRDLFPSSPMQRATSSPIASALDKHMPRQ